MYTIWKYLYIYLLFWTFKNKSYLIRQISIILRSKFHVDHKNNLIFDIIINFQVFENFLLLFYFSLLEFIMIFYLWRYWITIISWNYKKNIKDQIFGVFKLLIKCIYARFFFVDINDFCLLTFNNNILKYILTLWVDLSFLTT